MSATDGSTTTGAATDGGRSGAPEDDPTGEESRRAADIREAVRARYGGIARGEITGKDGCGCGGGDAGSEDRGPDADRREAEGGAAPARAGGCCGGGVATDADDADGPEAGRTVTETDLAREIGYDEEELASVPEGSNLGLGCGNPVALASLSEGEVVVDLGSGAGFDAFLAADRVGPDGRVIGVDMTPEMVERARENARDGDYENVDFRLGEIEHLPVADGVADAIISNCVINLSADRPAVFREAHRVLRPGGRLMISDLVTTVPVPAAYRDVMELFVSCLPVERDRYLAEIREAGFRDVEVVEEGRYPVDALAGDPAVRERLASLEVSPEEAVEFASTVRSARIRAVKPGA